MTQGRQTTRLDRIEDTVSQRLPQGPLMMPEDERWEFVQNLVGEILDGDDGRMGRKFAELGSLDREVVSNNLHGGWSLGWWGDADGCQRVKGWLAGQNGGRSATASRRNFRLS